MPRPRKGDGLSLATVDTKSVAIDLAALAATLVALLFGWLTVRHCRQLMHEGVELADGGGYAALIMLEFVACMAAVGVALNV